VLALFACACGAPPAPEPPAGVVLIVLDTLRADGLSAYGNPRPTSPAIDRLAQEGVLFEQVVSHAAWTLPGFIGLLTGRYPSEAVFGEGRLRASLVEPLRRAGFVTAAFTEGAYVSEHFGMDRGFEDFWEHPSKVRVPAAGGRDAEPGGVERTFAAAIAWLERNADARFFLMVHTYEPHIPYRRRDFAEGLPPGRLPGPTYEVGYAGAIRQGELRVGRTEREYVRALYDGGVLASDAQVGRLLAALERLGVAERTVVALTSDHGEDLGGRNPRHLGLHQHQVYDDLLRVPLIVRDPRRDWPVRRVSAQVRLVDVMPTLLELAGLDAPEALDGRSLVPLMEGRRDPQRLAFAELRTKGGHVAAVRTERRKLIENLPPRPRRVPQFEFYDLENDPGEHVNLATDSNARMRELAESLRGQREAIEAAGGVDLDVNDDVDEETRRQLEALGYVE
jgi:arylsulfatase A-like enzyme